MLFTNFSTLLFLLQFQPFGFAAEQKVLKGGKANPLNEDFEKLVHETLELWHVPGVAIGVVDGDLEWSQGYGIATYPDTKVTPSTLFYGGSTTKAFTAAVMSMLVDDNANFSNVQWKSPIIKLIPDDFALSDEYATIHTTIEDALSHRSGFPRHDYAIGGNYEGQEPSLRGMVRAMRHLPLTAEPRTRFQYSNQMYGVASHVIETLTGSWLGDVLKEKIWEPLNMKATFFSTSNAEKAPEHLAEGYVYYNKKFQPVQEMDLTCVSGGGSVISNVLDYTKWLKAHLSMSGPISKAGYKAIRTARSIEDRDDAPVAFTGNSLYALGWSTGVYQGYEYFEHSGGMVAFGTELIFFPALNYGLVAFANTAVTSNWLEQALVWHLIDEHLGIPKEDRFDWNKRNQDRMQKSVEEYKNGWKEAYPNIPNPRLPTTLPVQNYMGTYFNPGYNNITIEIKDGALYANRSDATLKLDMTLEHISGDYFMAYGDSTEAPGLPFKVAAPAEFKISPEGISKTLGLAAEPEMGKDGRIWFERL